MPKDVESKAVDDNKLDDDQFEDARSSIDEEAFLNYDENPEVAPLDNKGAIHAGEKPEVKEEPKEKVVEEQNKELKAPAAEKPLDNKEVEEVNISSDFDLDATVSIDSELKPENEQDQGKVAAYNKEGKNLETLEKDKTETQDQIKIVDKEIEYVKDTDEFKRKEKVLTDKVSFHDNNIDKLKSWAEEKNEGELNAEAFKFYKETIGTDGLDKAFEAEADKEAKKRLVTREALIAFEKKRMTEANKGDKELLLKLFDYLTEKGIKKFEEPSPDFATFYYTIAKPVAKEEDSELFTDEEILKAERKRIDEESYNESKRVEQYVKKLEELGITDDKMDLPNKDFAEYYKKNGGKFYFQESIINGLVDVNKIIDIEVAELSRDKATKNAYEIYKMLADGRKKYENETGVVQEMMLEIIRSNFFGTNGFKLSDVESESYRFATAADIIKYEKGKVKEEERKLFAGKNTVGDLIKSLSSYYKEEKKDPLDLIRENVDIETLIKYEDDQRKLAAKNHDMKNEGIHSYRRSSLYGIYEYIKELPDEEQRKEQIKILKADYFSGKLDRFHTSSKDVDEKAMDFLQAAVEGKYIADNEEIIAILKDEVKKRAFSKEFMFSDNHHLLLEKLKAFQEKNPSDEEMLKFYQKERGLDFSHYSKDMAEKNKGKLRQEITLDQMYMYATSKLKDMTRLSWSTRKLKGLDDSKVTNRFDRIQALMQFRDSEEYSQLDEATRRQKLKDLYLGELKAGGALEKYAYNMDKTIATPRMILDHEKKLIHDENLKKVKDLELLRSGRVSEFKETVNQGGNDYTAWLKTVLMTVRGSAVNKKADGKLIDIVTPMDILSYQHSLFKKSGEKYEERFLMLKDDSYKDKEVCEAYMSKYGGEDFFKSKTEQIDKLKKTLIAAFIQKGTFSYDRLLKYEEDKKNNYQKEKDNLAQKEIERHKQRKRLLNSNLKKINEAIKELKKQKPKEAEKEIEKVAEAANA